ncbi:putative phage abortive infection protein [Gaoshiqia sp. Z1-71]|uniref:putative phage abortive infection protein n=1 Tax=Gaoshiqia hydrogeniformans TaxID=3290090 RepID=UPI003BF7AC00
MDSDTYLCTIKILFALLLLVSSGAIVLVVINKYCSMRKANPRILIWRNVAWGIGVILLLVLLILLFIEGSSYHRFHFGHIETKVWAEFGSFIGGILLAATLIYQIVSFRRQQIEAKFFELVKYYRDNVNEMKLKNPFYYTDKKDADKTGDGNKVREFDEKYVEGRRVFKIIFDQYRVAYGICKNSEVVNAGDPMQLVQKKMEEDFSEYFRLFTNNDEVKKRFIENEIAYLITFWGVPDDSSKEIDDRLKRQYVLTDSKIPLLKKGLINYFKSLVATYEANDPSKYSAMLKKWKNGLIISGEKKTLVMGESPGGKMKFFGGHQYHLGHYFRHLYQAVTFINDQPWWLMDRGKKYGYIKTLRAQMSNYEQALLFINSLTILGRNWELNSQRKEQRLITKYNLIKNLPKYFVPDMDPANYYPRVDFEYKDDKESMEPPGSCLSVKKNQ